MARWFIQNRDSDGYFKCAGEEWRNWEIFSSDHGRLMGTILFLFTSIRSVLMSSGPQSECVYGSHLAVLGSHHAESFPGMQIRWLCFLLTVRGFVENGGADGHFQCAGAWQSREVFSAWAIDGNCPVFFNFYSVCFDVSINRNVFTVLVSLRLKFSNVIACLHSVTARIASPCILFNTNLP